MFKLTKALYGLQQALRAWYETLNKFLLKNNFIRENVDTTLYIKKNEKDIIIVQIYIVDIIFGLIIYIKNFLQQRKHNLK